MDIFASDAEWSTVPIRAPMRLPRSDLFDRFSPIEEKIGQLMKEGAVGEGHVRRLPPTLSPAEGKPAGSAPIQGRALSLLAAIAEKGGRFKFARGSSGDLGGNVPYSNSAVSTLITRGYLRVTGHNSRGKTVMILPDGYAVLEACRAQA